MSLTASVIAVGIATFFLWKKTNALLFDDFFSPFNLLYYFWVLPLLSRALNLSYWESSWTNETVAAVALVTSVLVIVSIIAGLTAPKLPSFEARRETFLSVLDFVTGPRVRTITWLLFIPLLVLFFWTEFASNPAGIALFSWYRGALSPEDAGYYGWGKVQGRTPFTSLILTLTQWLTILNPMILLQARRAQGVVIKITLVGLALVTSCFAIAKLSKTDLLTNALALGMVSYYCRRYQASSNLPWIAKSRQGLPPLLWLSVVAFVGLVFTATVRIGQQDTGPAGSIVIQWIGFKYDEPTVLNTMGAILYSYTALNFENVNRFISSYDGGWHLGISAFRPFLSAIVAGRVADRMWDEIDLNVLPGGAIAGTLIVPLYAEAGWLGLLVVPLVYAIFVNVLYLRFRRSPNYRNLFTYSIFSFCWSFMFFTNAFGTLLFYTTAAFVFLMGFVSTGRRSVNTSETTRMRSGRFEGHVTSSLRSSL